MTFNDFMHLARSWSVVLVGVVFTLILITTFWPSRKARYARDAMIPLQDPAGPSDHEGAK